MNSQSIEEVYEEEEEVNINTNILFGQRMLQLK